MSETTALSTDDISLTAPAQTKMAELIGQVEEAIEGVRVYATPGGCSGINFGMTFTDQINDNDGVLDCDGFKVIIDDGTMQHLKGVEIDFVDRGDGG
ncbi:MAG: iron-sulfur cluster assembly accessory protein, partial [Sedimenticola sp.]